jgi:hypothetical protein
MPCHEAGASTSQSRSAIALDGAPTASATTLNDILIRGQHTGREVRLTTAEALRSVSIESLPSPQTDLKPV